MGPWTTQAVVHGGSTTMNATRARRSSGMPALWGMGSRRESTRRRRGPSGFDFGPHRRAGGNRNDQRREGARDDSGDQCGVTRGVEMRGGEEWRARCGEAEAGHVL
jgi:hypothetical protein